MMMLGLVCLGMTVLAQRTETLLQQWQFHRGDVQGAEAATFDDSSWERVGIPHDWAITGPFDRANDLQTVAVTQNGETEASEKTGRTGGLPYVGVGWYRTRFTTSEGKHTTLVFDGAMSEAEVYVNGRKAAFWPYGYNSFFVDVTPFLHEAGMENVVAVRLENRPQSARWYPGAGLYRNVHLVETSPLHVPVWGTQVLARPLQGGDWEVELRTSIANAPEADLCVTTDIVDAEGRIVASRVDTRRVQRDGLFVQHIVVPAKAVALWSPETPQCYRAVTRISCEGAQADAYSTVFGLRTLDYEPERGFLLNGRLRKFQGVCLHHDLGPLGAAVSRSGLIHQLKMLKDMGCDAIRTSHNMPAPELVQLCDSLGFMMMLEPFDEWDIAKCENGYHRYFNEWAERDMVNMLHHYRNNPSVVMWSIGNEVPTQCSPEGYKVAKFLQDICHREDPTRKVTCGMDQVDCVLDNGFAAMIDIPGFNYRAHRYDEAHRRLPQGIVLGSETASTVSSRGVYKFPVVKEDGRMYDDNQCSSYDMEACWWSNVPEADFANMDNNAWTIGQFVWTSFDYLGEPTPYDTDAWPSHSSYFGIIDLASLPKDRYWLYRSQWNRRSHTLHLLPHWTWPGREGELTPVYVYTDYPEAELFVNGHSQGRRVKGEKRKGEVNIEAYRLMWNDVRYEPGEIRVVAYDADGRPAEERTLRTAGKPHHLELVRADAEQLSANGKDLAYLTVRLVDKDGNLCPHDGRLVTFDVQGTGRFRATANGDATCLDAFHLPQMHLFGGMCTVIVETATQPGTIRISAAARGVKAATTQMRSE